MCMYVCVPHMCQVVKRTEGSGFSGSGDGVAVSHHVVARNQICKISDSELSLQPQVSVFIRLGKLGSIISPTVFYPLPEEFLVYVH